MIRYLTLLSALLCSLVCSAQSYTLTEDDVIIEGDRIVAYKGARDALNQYINRIIIPSKIGGKEIKEIGARSFEYQAKWKLQSVEIQEGIERIGARAFQQNSIFEISLPGSLQTIGDSAFYMQRQEYGVRRYIELLDIPDMVTRVGRSAFEDCYIKKLRLGSSLKVILTDAFSFNYLTEIELPEGLEKIYPNAFIGNEIKKFNIPASLKYLSGFAGNGMEIDELQIPSTVEEVGDSAFAENKISKVVLHSKLRRIGKHAFSYCDMTGDLFIPASVESIGPYAFYACGFKNLQFAEGITSVDYAAFSNCYVENLILPSTITTIEDYAFAHSLHYSCINWETSGTFVREGISLSGALKRIGSFAFGQSQVRSISLTGKGLEVADDAFNACSYIKKITIGKGVVSIGQRAFGADDILHSWTIDLKNAVDLKLIKPGAFNDVNIYNTFDLPENGTWYSYDTDPSKPDPKPTTQIFDATRGYVNTDLAPLVQVPADADAVLEVYDIMGRKHGVNENLAPGVYILKTAKTSRKVIVPNSPK